jgi:hypothetical protein
MCKMPECIYSEGQNSLKVGDNTYHHYILQNPSGCLVIIMYMLLLKRVIQVIHRIPSYFIN